MLICCRCQKEFMDIQCHEIDAIESDIKETDKTICIAVGDRIIVCFDCLLDGEDLNPCR